MNRHKAKHLPLRWLFAVSALSLGFAGYTTADDRIDGPSVKVNYADLDLNKPAGAQALYGRIERAARSVCGRVDRRELTRYRLYRQCYDEAIDAAVKQANHNGLFAVHYRKFKARAPG